MPMDHDAAKELFSAHLDGELEQKIEEELSAHLEECETCRQEFEELRQTLRSLSGLHKLMPPEAFVSKVQQRINRRSRGRFFGRENLLTRIPFEWISFVIIILLLMLYIAFIQTQDAQFSAPAEADGGHKNTQEAVER